MTFDARSMRLLSAGDHLTSDDYPGLRMVASAKHRTWTYRYKSPVDGRMRQVSLGRWPAVSTSAAIEAWEAARAERDAGGDPAVTRKARRSGAIQSRAKPVAAPTVGEVAAFYLAHHVQQARQEKGAVDVARLFAHDLGALAGADAATLSRAQAFELISSLSKRAPVQAQKLRSELGAAWDYALDAGKLPADTPNWWRLILRGKIRSKGKKIAGKRVATSKRSLTDDELRQVLGFLPNVSRTVADALTLYCWTALRGAEIMQIEGREVAPEADGVLWWTIPKNKTKNARHSDATDMRVPLFGRAREVVERRIAEYGRGYLFPSEARGHIPQKVVSEAVYFYQPYCKIYPHKTRPRWPVSHWAPHDLRRTSRTMLAAMSCPWEVAEAIVGHMLPGVTGTYNRHSYDAERRLWLGRLDERLSALVGAA